MTVDQFPMTITTPTGVWSRARLLVTATGHAYVIDQGGFVVCEASGGAPVSNDASAGGWTVTTADGDWKADRELSGCGCQAGPSRRTADRLLAEANAAA